MAMRNIVRFVAPALGFLCALSLDLRGATVSVFDLSQGTTVLSSTSVICGAVTNLFGGNT